MNTLYASETRYCMNKLADVERRIAEIHAGSPEHHWRCEWIAEDLKAVRDTLLRASCADVAVETTETA